MTIMEISETPCNGLYFAKLCNFFKAYKFTRGGEGKGGSVSV